MPSVAIILKKIMLNAGDQREPAEKRTNPVYVPKGGEHKKYYTYEKIIHSAIGIHPNRT